MNTGKSLLVGIGVFVVGVVSGCTSFDKMVAESLREQRACNEAVKPLLDAVVTKKLKIGDSIEHVEEVLRGANLSFEFERFDPSELRSIYRTGEGCGFTIAVKFDPAKRVARIDVREFFTGP